MAWRSPKVRRGTPSAHCSALGGSPVRAVRGGRIRRRVAQVSPVCGRQGDKPLQQRRELTQFFDHVRSDRVGVYPADQYPQFLQKLLEDRFVQSDPMLKVLQLLRLAQPFHFTQKVAVRLGQIARDQKPGDLQTIDKGEGLKILKKAGHAGL